MRKALKVFLIGTLFIGTTASHAAMPPKVGAICTKAGAVTTIKPSNKKLICNKVGNKLMWASTSSSKTNPKATTFQEPPAITSFSDLNTKFTGIHYWAWKHTHDAEKSAPNFTIPIEIKIGPNSANYSKFTNEAVTLVNKIFHGAKLPTKVWMVYTSEEDTTWGQITFSALLSPLPTPNPLSPRANNKGEAVVALFTSPGNAKDDYVKNGSTDAHEYTHSLQFLQFIGSSVTPYSLPRWMFEGGGQFIQDFQMYGIDYDNYLSHRLSQQLNSYDLTFYKEFLFYKSPMPVGVDGDPWVYTAKWPNQRVYDVGSLVYEVLIAIKDPASVLNLMQDVAKTGDMNLSFKTIYGISWDEAQPIICEAIYKLLKA